MAVARGAPAYPTIGGANANTAPHYRRGLRRLGLYGSVTLFASMMLTAFLMPFAYMLVTSFKDRDQIVASATGPVLPVDPLTVELDGRRLTVYRVPLDGEVRELALLRPGRRDSVFVDPADPSSAEIEWVGAWRTLSPVYV